jgi:type IV secretory pathway VirB4 component
MKSKTEQNKKKSLVTTQNHLLISEVKQDTVVMKDGTLRAVLMVSSINFALKNEDEQNAIIGSYVSFLNSLDHPLQVVVQSRRLQIKPYIDRLIEMEKSHSNDLLRTQTADYRSFVTELVKLGEIMNKRFYVVVPYDPLSNKSKSFWSRLKEVINPTSAISLKGDRFTSRKNELDSRVRIVEGGLSSVGLMVARLNTQSLIELYFSTFNTDIALTQELGSLDQLQVETE